MKSIRAHPVLATVALAAVAMTTTTMVVSAYTFDPLNNMWKPSGANHARKSSSASSYAPHPSEVEAPPVFEEEVIRAQYSTWAGHYHNGVDNEHGESFQQKSLAQIEYNQRTGEVSLMDQDGIITKETYQNLMRAVSTGNDGDMEAMMQNMDGTATPTELDVVGEDVALGTTHFVDGEDIDQSQVIDTASEEVKTSTDTEASSQVLQEEATETDVAVNNVEVEVIPQPIPHHHHHHQVEYQTIHQAPQQEQQQQQPVAAAASETFNTYTIPQPPQEIQSQLQEQQYQQIQHVQQQQQQFHQQQQQQSMMAYQRPQGHPAQATAVAEPATGATAPGGWGFNDRRSTFMN